MIRSKSVTSPLSFKVVGNYLIYCINEGLGITPREMSDSLDLTAVGEYGCYQSNASARGKGITDQPFPSRKVATPRTRSNHGWPE